MKTKKGMSNVVTSIIIIALALVAFGIVYVLIMNVIEKQANRLELEKSLIDSVIFQSRQTCYDSDSNQLFFGVKRGGARAIDGLEFGFVFSQNFLKIGVPDSNVGENLSNFSFFDSSFTQDFSFINFIDDSYVLVPFFQGIFNDFLVVGASSDEYLEFGEGVLHILKFNKTELLVQDSFSIASGINGFFAYFLGTYDGFG